MQGIHVQGISKKLFYRNSWMSDISRDNEANEQVHIFTTMHALFQVIVL